MYGGQEHAAAGSPGQMFPKFIPAFHLYYTFIADELLSRSKKFGKLVIQIGTVGYQDYRRTGKLPASHQHTGKEQHRDTLATTRCPEVSSSFSIAAFLEFGVQTDILEQLACGKELRIAANHFLLVFRRIGKEHEILYHAQQPLFPEQAFYHRQKGVDAVCCLKRELMPSVALSSASTFRHA